MSALKKPEFILSGINTVAIVGVSIYFSKQISTLQQKINDLVQINTKLATELETVKGQIGGIVVSNEETKTKMTNFARDIATDHKTRAETIDEKLKKSSIDNSVITSDLLIIAKTLRDLGIDFELSTDNKDESGNGSAHSLNTSGNKNNKGGKNVKGSSKHSANKNNSNNTSGKRGAKSAAAVDNQDSDDSSSDDDHASSVRRRRKS
jgi:hypothetical protein